MMYEYSEHFIMPLSHDEVVHGKGSLLNKMPGDHWQKFANLRLLLAYQYTRPGKQLVFMGTELAPWREWNHDAGLEWHLAGEGLHGGFGRFVEALGRLYVRSGPLWRHDPAPEGFRWIECCDKAKSVTSYLRFDGPRHLAIVLNLTPAPHAGYRLGVPDAGEYRVVLNSDDPAYGGSGYHQTGALATEPVPWNGFPQSICATLPPLGALVLAPAGQG
jgi:1,4-alpha-glucan branching enzyme